jgi:hypothetical protein
MTRRIIPFLLLFLVNLPLPVSAEMALVPQTGQTTCYDSEGVSIDCAGTGQDADNPQGVPWPEPRFVDNQNGTITDNLTGLLWLKNANCTETVGGVVKSNGYQNWADAVAWSNALHSGNCGLTDGSTTGQWRLPNRNELKSLNNLQQTNAATWLSGMGFVNVEGYSYWSSSTKASSTSYAWLVSLYGGALSSSNKIEGFYVWPVRSGPAQSASVQLPRTGQTFSYATGDDGALQKGVVWPGPRFTDLTDGSVYDKLTGLIWLKNANCFKLTWNAALSAANGLASGACGLSDGSVAGDWRLPTVEQLESLIDLSQNSPALLAGHPFTNVQWWTYDSYWSSSNYANRTGSAWSVNIGHGNTEGVGKNIYSYSVWPVRTGPSRPGDTNNDKTINVFDALLTLQYAVGLFKPTNEAAFKTIADVAPLINGKPKGDDQVNVFDALSILRHAVNLDPW